MMSHGATVMEKPRTEAVKIANDVLESAKLVATMRKQRVSDLLTEILRPIVAKMEKAEIAKRTKGGE